MKKWKSILAGILVGILTAITPAAAAVDLEASYPIATNELENWPQGPEIMADTGILMEAETGVILYDKGANERRYPASITKLMTLLVAVENAKLKEKVTFTETGIRDIAPDSTNLGMQLGETLSMKACLYAMMLYSANEVSTQIAEYVGGTEQAFIDMMNQRAEEIGCKNTHFTNANGLPDENHYTTAYDMALIFREGLKNKTFRKIINTRKYVIKPTNKNDQSRSLQSSHPLFSELSGTFYPSCIGGKTGGTIAAGRTLVSGAEENGVTYIVVVLRDVDIFQSGVDSKLLFDYGYQNFRKEEVEGGSVLLPAGVNQDALTMKEEITEGIERQCYYLSDHLVGVGSKPDPAEETENSSEQGDAAQSGQSGEPGYPDGKTAGTEDDAPGLDEETDKSEADGSGKESVKSKGDESNSGGNEVKSEEDAADSSENAVSSEKDTVRLSKTARILLIVMAGMIVLLIVLCILLGIKNRKNRRYR